jgi:hypothetical protein
MDSFAILLFSLILILYFIPCVGSEPFRGGGGGGGRFGGGGFGGGGLGGRGGGFSGGFSGGFNPSSRAFNSGIGSLNSGYSSLSNRAGLHDTSVNVNKARGGYWNGYGPGWYYGPGWSYGLNNVVEDGIWVDDNPEDQNVNYANNYYSNDFDSDYVDPIQQKLMISRNEH